MIQFLADNIDQLDLALDQLAVSDRNFDRFALMLIDNVVELTLHRFIQDKDRENRSCNALREPKHDPKKVEKALGQNFDTKVRFASSFGLIDSSACESILYLHAFRNTVYHQGSRHERILHSLTLFYFQIACDLLGSYNPRSWSWGTTERISHRAAKYIGHLHVRDHREVFRAAYVRLREVAASMVEDLIGDLSSDMEVTIDAADKQIEYLTEGGPAQISRDEAIQDCQVWPFAFTDEAKNFARTHGFQKDGLGSYVEWLARNYKWPITSDPIPGWRSRLKRLRKESDYHKALKRYCDFLRQTEDIRFKLTESAGQLDQYVEEQVEALRGN